MTLQEFKAWFDGFTENMGEAPPTKLQWARIQARVKEIDGTAITSPVVIDRNWPYDGHTVFNIQPKCALGQTDYAAIQ